MTPVLEDLGVFLRVGEATDVVTKEMYEFADRDGTRVALRPEITASVVRSFVQHRPTLPWKVWYAGTNFRHERPQKGRYRMFDQVGVEVLGVDDPDLDVEVVALAAGFVEALGLRRVRLIVNSLGDHDDRDRYATAVETYLRGRAGELSDTARATLERNPLRVLDAKRPEDRAVVADAPKVSDFLSDASAEHYRAVPRRPRFPRHRPRAGPPTRARTGLLPPHDLRARRRRTRCRAERGRWRRPLRRSGRGPRRSAHRRHRVRARCRPAAARSGRRGGLRRPGGIASTCTSSTSSAALPPAT